MKISDIDSKLFEKCWKGYKSHGTKKMFGKTVPDCRKNEGALDEMPAMTLHGPDGFGLTQYSGDEYALVGGFRDGASNAGELRLKYQIYSHALIAANDGNFEKGEIGYCVVRVASDDGPDQGEILGLIDIELKPKYRKSGHGKKIVRDIVDTTKSGNLDIHDIQKKAKKFWDKMGVEYKSKQTGSAQNAVLRKQSEQIEEDLRAWFGKGKKGGAGGGGWDRYNTKGERVGKCGDSGKGEGKPKCLSKSRAASLRSSGGKKAIANAVKRKKSKDPNANRRGKAKNVNSHPKK